MTWRTKLPDNLKDRLPRHENKAGSQEETQSLLTPQQCLPRRQCPILHSITERHLREFCGPRRHRIPSSSSSSSSSSSASSSAPSTSPLPSAGNNTNQEDEEWRQEPLTIKTKRLRDFVRDGLFSTAHQLRHPNEIPGRGWWSKIYALGMFPMLIGILVFCKWTIGVVLLWSTNTRFGKYMYGWFLKDQILLYDETDVIDPEGTDEAMRQLVDRQHKTGPMFSYHLANLLLVLSTLTYERDDAKVQEAAKILEDIDNKAQRESAARLLFESEQMIDSKAQLFGMRFQGISELKSLGGPFAGLFYNDEAIILVFKGTTVLAFNEYVMDAYIQRVDASEYLYGEVHQGFYEALFPDVKPHTKYERKHYDTTNPFNTIMETIFELALEAKKRTGKPVQLWMSGHSLGGALASMTMARLQKPLTENDPLFHRENPAKKHAFHAAADASRTVLCEMLSRFYAKHNLEDPSRPSGFVDNILSHLLMNSNGSSSSSHRHQSWDQDLIVLRDVYSFASPKFCNSMFALHFDQNQVQYVAHSPFKPVYFRVIVDKDIIPRMPPSCSTDPDDPHDRLFPCPDCPQHKRKKQTEQLKNTDKNSNDVMRPGHHRHSTVNSNKTLTVDMTPEEEAANVSGNESKHQKGINSSGHVFHHHDNHEPQVAMGSLLDYRHIGQLVSVYNNPVPPVVKPSEFQTDLTGGTLRNNQDMLELLSKLEMTQTEAETQPEDESDEGEDFDSEDDHMGNMFSKRIPAARRNNKSTTATASTGYQTFRSQDSINTLSSVKTKVAISPNDGQKTILNAKPATTTTNPRFSTSTSSSVLLSAQQILDEMSLAQAKHEADALQRLRVPCDAERDLPTQSGEV
ncbi:hypothetical protein BG004_005267 [Podila humilis]|nr:hypothetical protein BG004_005267 [Podila humilis]